VSELLPQGVGGIPALSDALVTISRALESEMAAMPSNEVRRAPGGRALTGVRWRALRAAAVCGAGAAAGTAG
jgi:hypothetical protein